MVSDFTPEPFGKYYLVDRIGAGGMAEVFRAQTFAEGGFQKLLVIKRILQHLSEDEEFVGMFVDEARVSARLQHPNIVQIYDFGRHEEHHYIAMEYVEGRDQLALVRSLTREKRLLPMEYAVYIIHEVCKGLHHAHNQTSFEGHPLGIVHRDISHSNVLFSYEGEVKITDFGIAKAEINHFGTQDGQLKGKLEYMSPEQVGGEAVDPRSDLFSAGILLWEMLTGRRLFKSDSVGRTIHRIRSGDVTPPSRHNPAVPARLEEIVMQALAVDPGDRFQEARDLRNALRDFMAPATPDSIREDFSTFSKKYWAEAIEEDRRRLARNMPIAIQMWDRARKEAEAPQESPSGPGTVGSGPTPVPGSDAQSHRLRTLLLAALALAALGALAYDRIFSEPEVRERVVEVPAPSPSQGSIHLLLQPPSAEVFLGDQLVGSGAEVVYNEVPPDRELTLKVQAPGFRTYTDTVELEPGVRLKMPVTLSRLPSRTASPTASPADATSSSAASSEPAASEPAPDPAPGTPAANPDADTSRPAQPGPEAPPITEPEPAQVRFESDPPGAEVRVKGELLGTTPFTWNEARPGSYDMVKLSLEGHHPANFVLSVDEQPGPQTERRTLLPREDPAAEPAAEEPDSPREDADRAWLSVFVTGGWAFVYLDGRKLDASPPVRRRELDPGTYEVRVESPSNPRVYTKTVTLDPGEHESVTFRID